MRHSFGLERKFRRRHDIPGYGMPPCLDELCVTAIVRQAQLDYCKITNFQGQFQVLLQRRIHIVLCQDFTDFCSLGHQGQVARNGLRVPGRPGTACQQENQNYTTDSDLHRNQPEIELWQKPICRRWHNSERFHNHLVQCANNYDAQHEFNS